MKKIIHPLWILWLMPNMVLAIAGGTILANEWRIPFIPYLVAIINIGFILYYALTNTS